MTLRIWDIKNSKAIFSRDFTLFKEFPKPLAPISVDVTDSASKIARNNDQTVKFDESESKADSEANL